MSNGSSQRVNHRYKAFDDKELDSYEKEKVTSQVVGDNELN
jgi:hypothetical protein